MLGGPPAALPYPAASMGPGSVLPVSDRAPKPSPCGRSAQVGF